LLTCLGKIVAKLEKERVRLEDTISEADFAETVFLFQERRILPGLTNRSLCYSIYGS